LDNKEKLEEYIRNKRHVCWVLNPLVEDYSVDSTIAVYVLNPVSFFEKVPESVLDVLRDKGYTRLYVLYLFSRIGEFGEWADLPAEELLDSRCNDVIGKIIPDVGKVLFAYGQLPDERMRELVDQRMRDVQQRIESEVPGMEFYRFGALTETGDPKSLVDVQDTDEEHRFYFA